MSHCFALRLLPVALVFGVVQAAESVHLDHLKPGTQADVAVEPGDTIEVSIENTCPAAFEYSYLGFTHVEPTEAAGPTREIGGECTANDAQRVLQTAGYCKLETKKLSIVHSKTFTAYEVRVARKKDGPGGTKNILGLVPDAWTKAVSEVQKTCDAASVTQKPQTLDDNASYLVSVEHSPWALGMSGGLTISDLVNPRFAVIDDPASTATPPGKIVIRDRDAEDEQQLGFAGFLHIHNEKWQWKTVAFAGTLGLGIEEKNAISGFIGVSAAAWDLGYLTVGWNWRAVDRLPSGQKLNAPPLNDNVLSSLPTRTDSGWFIGVSFKLMSPGESFFKQKIAPADQKPKT